MHGRVFLIAGKFVVIEILIARCFFKLELNNTYDSFIGETSFIFFRKRSLYMVMWSRIVITLQVQHTCAEIRLYSGMSNRLFFAILTILCSHFEYYLFLQF